MGYKILVVDDEKDIREFLSIALTRVEGFSVELAENGEEALQKIDRESFDLVLTDLKMPKMDGLQLLSEIVDSKPEILTVLMTGYGSINSALEAIRGGASDYIMKPVDIAELDRSSPKGARGETSLRQTQRLGCPTGKGKSRVEETGRDEI